MTDVPPLLQATTALTASAALPAAGLGLAGPGLAVGAGVALLNLGFAAWMVRQTSRAAACGEPPGLAAIALGGKLPLGMATLALAGALFGAKPVIAGFTLAIVALSLVVLWREVPRLLAPMESL